MEFGWNADDLEFRADLNEFLSEELSGRWHGSTAVLGSPENADYSRRFCGLLADRGWLTPHWPKEHGGVEASPWRLSILSEELWSRGEPRGPQYMNVNWIGPSLMAYGTSEQMARYLPPISRGEVIWCQGFSESEAGSDLASLRTNAVLDGSEYIVNGSKLWTSYADLADHCYLLVRTGDGRQEGISVLLIDMDRPGIEVRKISGVVGEHSFNEVLISDLRVPVANRLGPENGGWKVVREALSYERVGAPRWARASRVLNETMQWALENGRAPSPDVLESVDIASEACEAARLLYYRVIDERAQGKPPTPNGNVARVAMVQAERAVAEACLAIQGAEVMRYQGLANQQIRKSLAAGVAAGTYEIQLNLISRLLLRLPKG
ncbi:MAG: acyl-CoA dehydrogenase [Chloroflexi bacterium]|nr:acyl-CoA dehydrogenase [Chloroflexota bacterium]